MPITKETASPPRLEPRRRPLSGQWWFWLVLLAIIAAGAWFFYPGTGDAQPTAKAGRPGTAGRAQGNGADRVMPVLTAAAKTGNINIYLTGLGSVTPLNTVAVKPRVDGQLMKVLFTEGQTVKQGDLLAEIDPRPYQVQLTQAQGQMARDQAQLKNAQIDLQRYRTLFEQDSIAKQQLDTQAALVRQYEGTVKADQGQIDSARLQLTYTRVTAPISGRLGLRQIDTGNVVHASDPNGLVVITQLQPVAVVFTIPEDSVRGVMKQLQAGNKLAVDAYNREQTVKLASGTLLTVDNQIDSATGTVKLKAQFANDDYALFPNQFVNVRLLLDVRRDATTVASAAVQRGTQGTFVYVVKADQTVTARPVKPGPVQGDETAIDSGLAPGEVVVVDGTDKLREGAKVEAVQRGAAAVAGPGAPAEHPAGGRRARDGAANGRSPKADARAGAGTGGERKEAATAGNQPTSAPADAGNRAAQPASR